MKLIHTADIHLDASFAAAGFPAGFGNQRRQALRDVFLKIMERAKAWPADGVLIAGDLFEQERVSRDTVAFLKEVFEMLRPIPVFIAPGNHDPFVQLSPYATASWPANVYIFDKPEWDSHALQHVPLTVHGFAFDGIEISQNPIEDLQVEEDGRVHVALGHGSERGHQPEGKHSYAPFDGGALAQAGLHYVALGHFHSVTPIQGSFDTVMYYSGTPEGHGFNETGARHYLEVEIDTEGEQPEVTVRPVPVNQTVYSNHALDCSALDHSQQLVEALRGLAGDKSVGHICKVTLTGTCASTIYESMQASKDAVANRFIHLALVDETLPPEDYDALALENTSLGMFVRRINSEIKDAPDEEKRDMLTRARALGVSAYRDRELPIQGLEGVAQ